jgi:hypothetical protein
VATEENEAIRPIVLNALRPLTNAINPATRHSIQARWDAMLRELAYLQGRRDARLQFVTSKGWSVEKLAVLFWCNSFYQNVIGPLESSLRASSLSLGVEIPISHGTEYFNRRRALRTQSATSEFGAVIGRLGFQRNWLFKNTANDIIFYLDRYERDIEGRTAEFDAF